MWYLIVSIPDLCTLSYFDYQSCFVCAAWWPKNVSPHFHLMLVLSQSSGWCVQSRSIIPFPGYPLCLVLHLRSQDDRFSYTVVKILLSISMWTFISHLDFRLHFAFKDTFNTGLSS